MIIHGDSLHILKTLEENSVDSIVTDPPYGLKFMGKRWDYEVPSVELWTEALRVLKPGGHLLSFGGTRTYHRMVVNIEDAGFEIRDQLAWVYGQGFPKSQNVLKAGITQGVVCGCSSKSESQMSSMRNAGLSEAVSTCETGEDSLQSRVSKQNLSRAMLRTESKESPANGKESGLEGRGDLQTQQGELHRPEICSMSRSVSGNGKKRQLHNGASSSDGETLGANVNSNRSSSSQGSQHSKQSHRESRAIPEQSTTQTCGSCGKAIIDAGLGSALKPSLEPIVMARKPLEKGLTVAANVLKYGTGGINIDASRIGSEERPKMIRTETIVGANAMSGTSTGATNSGDMTSQGRWPANILFDEEAAFDLDEQSGQFAGSIGRANRKSAGNYNATNFKVGVVTETEIKDFGGASRFFYVAKASKSERNKGLEGMPKVSKAHLASKDGGGGGWSKDSDKNPNLPRENHHPTVKPIKLMQYLIKLITPPQGKVLDPFAGSGSTGVACKSLGFEFIGIELNQEYVEIAERRNDQA